MKINEELKNPHQTNDEADVAVENLPIESTSELKIGDIFFTKKGNKIIENWVMN